LQSKVEIYENAIINFSNIKDDMSEAIEKLTEDLNGTDALLIDSGAFQQPHINQEGGGFVGGT
jgi:hypothetical protein